MSTKSNKWFVVAIGGVTCGGKSTLSSRLHQHFPNSVLICQDSYFYPHDSPKHVKVKGLDHVNYDILSALDMERMLADVLDILKNDKLPESNCLSSSNGLSANSNGIPMGNSLSQSSRVSSSNVLATNNGFSSSSGVSTNGNGISTSNGITMGNNLSPSSGLSSSNGLSSNGLSVNGLSISNGVHPSNGHSNGTNKTTNGSHNNHLPDVSKFRNKNILILDGFRILNYEPIAKLCDVKFELYISIEECKKRRSVRIYDPPDIPGYFEMCIWPESLKHREELIHHKDIVQLDGTKHNICFEVILNEMNSKISS